MTALPANCLIIYFYMLDILQTQASMGYDVCRFEGSVDEELICPICSAVLEDPRLAPEYDQLSCKYVLTVSAGASMPSVLIVSTSG